MDCELEDKYPSDDGGEYDSGSSSDGCLESYGAEAARSRGFSLSKSAKFKVANGTDNYVLIGTEEERQKDVGGTTVKMDIASQFGFAFTLPQKEISVPSGLRLEAVGIHR